MRVIYFSPSHTTKRAALALAKSFNEEITEIDITSGITEDISIPKEEITLIAAPVYSGRLPINAVNVLQQIKGSKTKVITMVVYGNREYDDALLELNDLCEKQGFSPIASCSFIGTHSYDQSIAAGRPNAADLSIAHSFGLQIQEIIREGSTKKVTVKGDYPYKERKTFPYVPIANDTCNNCGHCAEVCPTQAIDKYKLRISNKHYCISCMRCAIECPQQARHLDMPAEMYDAMIKGLNKKCQGTKVPELYF